MIKWKPINRFPGYEVSNYGDVKSIDRVINTSRGPRRIKGRNLKVIKISDDSEYRGVDLGRGNRMLVHRLVLEAFIGPCPDGLVCRHLDGNAANNNLDNLAWGTPEENMQDRILHGNNPKLNKTHCPQGHEYREGNLCETYAHRQCLACTRAYNYVRRHPDLDFGKVSWFYYNGGKPNYKRDRVSLS